MLSTTQDFKDYLLFMGAEEHSANIFLLHDKTIRFAYGNEVIVEQWKDVESDEDGRACEGGNYHETFRCKLGMCMPLAMIPYFFHTVGVVSLTEWLAEAAKGQSIDEKRAIYHLREAVKRLDAKNVKICSRPFNGVTKC